MEPIRATASNQNSSLPASSLLPQKPKTDPNAPTFMQALAEAVETVVSKTLPAEPATLARQVKPRSHLDLVSLNPVQTHYIPEAAALEKIGKSRMLPFSVGGPR